MIDKRSYAAAKNSNFVSLQNVNDLIGLSSPTVREKVRHLVRNFPYFDRAVRVLTDFSVGTGIELQARPLDKKGNYIPELAKQIEWAYSVWSEEADIAGRMNLKEMERLAKSQETETGEFIFIKTRSKDRNRFLPFALQMYEADWLTSTNISKQGANTRLEYGVEYEINTGKVLAYHFADPWGIGKSTKIDAKNVIHGFETLRPGQIRGISPLVVAVMVTADLQDAMESEIDGFKYAAKWLAFIKTMSPQGRQIGNGVNSSQIEELENGIIEYLNPGEEVVLSSNPRPSANFDPFVRLVLLMISAATGVPYELFSMDYRYLNWAVIKVVRADFRQIIKPKSNRHIQSCCKPIYAEFLRQSVLHGRLDIPDFWSNQHRYLNAVWQPPVTEAVDKLRDTKADISDMQAGLRSPQEITAARGRPLEDVYDEIAEAKKMAVERGISLEEVSTNLSNSSGLPENMGA